MSFTPMKLKPESGANRIRSADDAYSLMGSCDSPIDPNLIGRQPGKHSITCARQTQAKSGLGEPSGRRCPQKAGSWIEPSEV